MQYLNKVGIFLLWFAVLEAGHQVLTKQFHFAVAEASLILALLCCFVVNVIFPLFPHESEV